MRHRIITLALLVAALALFAVPRDRAAADGPPFISSISPTTGSTSGGTVLTIYGGGFIPGSTTYVSIGGVLSPSVTLTSPTTLTALTPAGVAGSAQIVVINSDGQSASISGFAFVNGGGVQNGSFWIAGINPPSGPNGQLVTVTGAGFDQTTTVLFGGVPATGTVAVTGTYLLTYAPPGPSGSVSVTITNATGASATAPSTFTYTGTAGTSTGSLSITSLSPTSVGAGSAFTIYGNGFLAGATVSVGGYLATNVSVSSSAAITAIAPTGPSGFATVTVTNPGGAAATYSGLSYGGTTTTTTGGQPNVTSVSPQSGSSAGGTVVTISGSGFAAPVTVTFGGIPATAVTVLSSYQISATTPPNSVGTVPVLVAGSAGSVGGLTSGFTYQLAWPQVTGISPSTGALSGGTTLTITGSGFAPGATVTIGGQPASTVSAVTPTQILVTTPPGAAGAAIVLVTNPGGAIAGLATGFAYSSNPQPQTPSTSSIVTVTGVTPNAGPSSGGTAISIFGTGFAPGALVSIGGVSVAATVVSSTQITTTTPAVTGTGNVSVSVANAGTAAFILPSAFTYGTGTGTGSVPTGTTGGTSSPVPAGGGLFVFAGGTNAQLLTASGCNASTAVFWTTNASGTWIGYIPSISVSVVNAAWTSLFPTGIPAGTPIYARC